MLALLRHPCALPAQLCDEEGAGARLVLAVTAAVLAPEPAAAERLAEFLDQLLTLHDGLFEPLDTPSQFGPLLAWLAHGLGRPLQVRPYVARLLARVLEQAHGARAVLLDESTSQPTALAHTLISQLTALLAHPALSPDTCLELGPPAVLALGHLLALVPVAEGELQETCLHTLAACLTCRLPSMAAMTRSARTSLHVREFQAGACRAIALSAHWPRMAAALAQHDCGDDGVAVVVGTMAQLLHLPHPNVTAFAASHALLALCNQSPAACVQLASVPHLMATLQTLYFEADDDEVVRATGQLLLTLLRSPSVFMQCQSTWAATLPVLLQRLDPARPARLVARHEAAQFIQQALRFLRVEQVAPQPDMLLFWLQELTLLTASTGEPAFWDLLSHLITRDNRSRLLGHEAFMAFLASLHDPAHPAGLVVAQLCRWGDGAAALAEPLVAVVSATTAPDYAQHVTVAVGAMVAQGGLTLPLAQRLAKIPGLLELAQHQLLAALEARDAEAVAVWGQALALLGGLPAGLLASPDGSRLQALLRAELAAEGPSAARVAACAVLLTMDAGDDVAGLLAQLAASVALPTALQTLPLLVWAVAGLAAPLSNGWRLPTRAAWDTVVELLGDGCPDRVVRAALLELTRAHARDAALLSLQSSLDWCRSQGQPADLCALEATLQQAGPRVHVVVADSNVSNAEIVQLVGLLLRQLGCPPENSGLTGTELAELGNHVMVVLDLRAGVPPAMVHFTPDDTTAWEHGGLLPPPLREHVAHANPSGRAPLALAVQDVHLLVQALAQHEPPEADQASMLAHPLARIDRIVLACGGGAGLPLLVSFSPPDMGGHLGMRSIRAVLEADLVLYTMGLSSAMDTAWLRQDLAETLTLASLPMALVVEGWEQVSMEQGDALLAELEQLCAEQGLCGVHCVSSSVYNLATDEATPWARRLPMLGSLAQRRLPPPTRHNQAAMHEAALTFSGLPALAARLLQLGHSKATALAAVLARREVPPTVDAAAVALAAAASQADDLPAQVQQALQRARAASEPEPLRRELLRQGLGQLIVPVLSVQLQPYRQALPAAASTELAAPRLLLARVLAHACHQAEVHTRHTPPPAAPVLYDVWLAVGLAGLLEQLVPEQRLAELAAGDPADLAACGAQLARAVRAARGELQAEWHALLTLPPAPTLAAALRPTAASPDLTDDRRAVLAAHLHLQAINKERRRKARRRRRRRRRGRRRRGRRRGGGGKGRRRREKTKRIRKKRRCGA